MIEEAHVCRLFGGFKLRALDFLLGKGCGIEDKGFFRWLCRFYQGCILGDSFQSGFYAVIYGAEHVPLRCELNFGLGGVHVNVGKLGRKVDKQNATGVFTVGDIRTEGFLQRRLNGFAFYVSAVNEGVLHISASSCTVGGGNKAVGANAFVGVIYLGKGFGKLSAEYRIDSVIQLSVAACRKLSLAVGNNGKGYIGVGKGKLFCHCNAGCPLGAVFFKEFLPCGGVIKYIPHRNGGAVGTARIYHNHTVLVGGKAGAHFLLAVLGNYIKLRNRPDSRQSLAAEAKGTNSVNIVAAAYFAGGVAQKRLWDILPQEPAAVVDNTHQASAAAFYFQSNVLCPCVY